MGKGDKRTRRGKIFRKSFGKARPRNPDKPETTVAAAAAPTAPVKKPVKKAAKKAAH